MLGILALPCYGSILFNQTPPDADPNGFSMTDFRIADDFTLATSDTITDILFYFKFASGGTADDLGALTYAMYSDNAGTPGGLLQSETIASGSITRTDQNALCTTCASATFSISSLDLGVGTYWLELHADSTLTGNNGNFPIDWAAVADNTTYGARFDYSGGVPSSAINFPGFNQYAFQLSGIGTSNTAAPAPEPDTLVFVTLGGVMTAIKARRKSVGR